MNVIGEANNNRRIVVVGCKELLMIEGKANLPITSNMYTAGTKIDVEAKWRKLTQLTDQVPEMENLVAKLRQAANGIENAIPY